MKKTILLNFFMVFLLILFFMSCPVAPVVMEEDEKNTGITDMDLWVDVYPTQDNTTGDVIYEAHAHISRDSDEDTAMFNDAVISVNGLALAFDDSYGQNGRFTYEGSGLVLSTGDNVTFNVSHPQITTLNFTLTIPQYVTTLNTSVSIDAYQAQATPTDLTLSWDSVVCDFYIPHIIMIWEGMSSGSGSYITETSYLFGPDDIEDDPEEGAPDFIGFDVETVNEIWESNGNGWYSFTVWSHHTPYICNESPKNVLLNLSGVSPAVKSYKSMKKTIADRPLRVK